MNAKLKNIVKNEKLKSKSKWSSGVCDCALLIIEHAEENQIVINKGNVLNVAKCGASSLEEASRGGCYLCYNFDIAEILATPSELKRSENGLKSPNSREDWVDVQTRALYQAISLIKRLL